MALPTGRLMLVAAAVVNLLLGSFEKTIGGWKFTFVTVWEW
jgi:hypothetical protein